MKSMAKISPWAFAFFSLVYIAGLFVNVMEVDAAQYASISREMADEGHWLQVMHRHANYLDKPPLLFWCSALMFKLFGVSTFAYKLPSFLFTLIGVYAVYRLGSKLFSQQAGTLAALILYGCQAWYSFNNDVRTDTMLAASVITAVWLLFEYINSRKALYFIGGFIFIALGMLAKGPLGLMVPALALGPYLLYKRDVKSIFNQRWLLGIALVLLLLAPMVYGLYQQYGTEGPRFFFWTQSFGRITGENVWKNDAGYFFFVHTFLWAFLPFSIITYWAAGHWSVQIVKSTFNAAFAGRVLVLAGFILPFIALSTSHYKLPHYIFVAGPFAALITAQYLLELKPIAQKVFTGLGVLVILAAIALTTVFFLWFFPLNNIGLWIVITGLFGFTIWLFVVNKGLERLVFPPLFALAVFNFVMNTHIYPALLTYHSSSVMAEYVNEHAIPKDKLRFTKALGHAFEFYAQTIIPETTTDAIAQQPGDIWLTTNDEGRNELIAKGIPIKEEVVFNHFHIVMLTGKFLNPATRSQVLEKRYLLHIVK